MSLKPRRIDFDEVWQQLSDTVGTVICGGGVARPVWNDRFSDVYAVCVANPEPMADKLYTATKLFLEAHVRELYRVCRTCCYYHLNLVMCRSSKGLIVQRIDSPKNIYCNIACIFY